MHVPLLLPLLIVAIDPAAPIDVRYPEGAEVFHCDFNVGWDENFDGWPDGWTRRRGRGFPYYVTAKITEDGAPVGQNCLRFDLDGGGAVAYSPPIEIASLYSYVLEGLVSTKGLNFDEAFLSLTVLDKDRHRLETFVSRKVGGSTPWAKLRLGPVSPGSDASWFAIIGLHLEPGLREDLTGTACFADVWLGQLPRISLSAGSVHHVFDDPDEISIACKASGFAKKNTSVVFHLEDAFGNRVAETTRWLKARPVISGHGLAADENSEEQPSLVGSAAWKPPIPGPGFYRVRATIQGDQTAARQRELSIALIRRQSHRPGGEFGWSLPRGGEPLAGSELSQLVAQAGVSWIKYPLWFDEHTADERIEEVVQLSERLTIHGIELVGLLNDPPQELCTQFDGSEPPRAAEVFSGGPSLWAPSLKSTMARLATQVRWWQLGQDTDTGFVGYPGLAEKIEEIKAELDAVGYDVNVGFGWSWMKRLPKAPAYGSAWRFLTVSADPPLTDRELAVYLSATEGTPYRRWVALEPLPARDYSLETRTSDLIHRIMAAKIHGADGIFLPDPFDPDRGLMWEDGTVGELFLPWRTTALMLGAAKHIGSIELPDGSPNHIFTRDDETVMVVWSDTPRREVIRLGSDVRQIDAWGRDGASENEQHRQVVEVGRVPSFVTGVEAPIIYWRQGLSFATTRIPSVVGRHQNRLRLRNPFDRGVAGTIEVVPPEKWQVIPERTNFQLASNEQLELPFQISLPYDVTSGRHRIRVDCEVQSGRTNRFSVYRSIDVGLGDVYIDVVTRLNQRGELEVEQRFTNDTDKPVDFSCSLFAPNRRRQRTQIIDVGSGRDVKTYFLPDGKTLIGKMLWLQAEEIDGPRSLNYRFIAKP